MTSPRNNASMLLFAFLVGLVGGCGFERRSEAPEGSESGGEKGAVGVSVLAMSDPFFKMIAEEVVVEVSRQGYEVIVVSGGGDPTKQSDQIESFLARGVLAILVVPCDSDAIGPAIEDANNAGVPVISAGAARPAPDLEVLSHIGSDNYGGGREAANLMIEALGEEGGELAILDHAASEPCRLSVQGFREVIEESNRERETGAIEIVEVLPGGGAKDQAYRATEGLIPAHPDLKAVFAVNDPSALGARAALDDAARNHVVIVAFGGRPEGRRAIKEGKIYAEPIHLPSEIGIEAANAILRRLDGEDVPREILIPTSVYRKADAEHDPSLP